MKSFTRTLAQVALPGLRMPCGSKTWRMPSMSRVRPRRLGSAASALDLADAVLARDRAAECECDVEDVAEGGLGGFERDGVGRVVDDGRVQVAVARVTEGRDGDAAPGGDALDSGDQFGEARLGHADVVEQRRARCVRAPGSTSDVRGGSLRPRRGRSVAAVYVGAGRSACDLGRCDVVAGATRCRTARRAGRRRSCRGPCAAGALRRRRSSCGPSSRRARTRRPCRWRARLRRQPRRSGRLRQAWPEGAAPDGGARSLRRRPRACLRCRSAPW